MSSKPLRKKSSQAAPLPRKTRSTRATVEKPAPKETDTNSEIAELKKMVQQLSKQKEPKKLSALNKFKKYVLSKVTEPALAETDFIDLIPVDKMRLLNKAYPIVWDQLVLEPIYQKYNCDTPEKREALRNKRNIQLDYNLQVDEIIDQMKEGELDDQEHLREDLTKILIAAIKTAAASFGSNEDEDDEEAGIEAEA